MTIQQLQHRLDFAQDNGLNRTLTIPQGIDLCSNDYLGFATDAVLAQRYLQRLTDLPLGAGGSRLVRGNLAIYEQTEALLAQFVNREAALLFSSGYSANVGLLSSLLQAGDLVFSDQLNHASIIDGISLSKAKKIIFPHRDYAYLAQQLQHYQTQPGLKLIVTESVFSMEGTTADLVKLAALAEQFQALLIVDEAHSTGLWGASLVNTLGLSARVFASVHPAGKALGAGGAWVASNHLLREYLLHFARSFVFSTAPSPALMALLQEAMQFYKEVGEQRAQAIRDRSHYLRQLLGLTTSILNDSPIISILVGDNKRALALSQYLQCQNWDVRAIRPPTVATGTARLRVTVKWNTTEHQLRKFANDLKNAFLQVPL